VKANPQNPLDPFSIKHLPKWNFRRALPTLAFRFHEFWSRRNFSRYMIPLVDPTTLQEQVASPPQGETAVTHQQRQVLAACLAATESLPGVCLEIGSYRGLTTRFMAERTRRKVIAIDPYFEQQGQPSHRLAFLQNTAPFPHVELLRWTSGEAAARIGAVSFCFIDAVHDYANVRFDICTYTPRIVVGGIVAFHDTDNMAFAGTRRAVFEFLQRTPEFMLLYHVQDLVTLVRRNGAKPDSA